MQWCKSLVRHLTRDNQKASVPPEQSDFAKQIEKSVALIDRSLADARTKKWCSGAAESSEEATLLASREKLLHGLYSACMAGEKGLSTLAKLRKLI